LGQRLRAARSRFARGKWLDGLRRRPVLERLEQLQLLASAPLAFDNSNYYVAVNGTNLMANDWDPDGGTFSAWETHRAMYPEGVFLPRSRGLPVLRLPPGTVPRDAPAVERIGPSTLMGRPRPQRMER
jgi:hypothetical protein